ncbi:MAG: peptide chain release factor N(5)-glutamine methyltransferase [Novosphingobium sp.]|nr:peptide chain release factor N(5)-glutamine methyltransferase [Novosphingobium sp.]
MQVHAALRDAASALASVSDTPRLDAELLMAHTLGITRSELLLQHMDGAAPDGFAVLLARRQAHEPIAYILGHQEFYGIRLAVGPDVLIPRSDSEVLVGAALTARPEALDVLDCGTGSGALLLAVLSHLPRAQGTGIDRSREALQIAADNAASLNISRASFLQRDWNTPGWPDDLGTFDLILINPPYVETGADLSPDVRDHEPASALFAGADGLNDYRALLPRLPALLRPRGAAFVEIGASQADAACEIANEAGFAAELHRDLEARPRVLQLTAFR